jgi:hypothetical protein
MSNLNPGKYNNKLRNIKMLCQNQNDLSYSPTCQQPNNVNIEGKYFYSSWYRKLEALPFTIKMNWEFFGGRVAPDERIPPNRVISLFLRFTYSD